MFFESIPWHPSGFSGSKFQKPFLQRSQRRPSMFSLQWQRPDSPPVIGLVIESHIPSSKEPLRSQSHAENESLLKINLQGNQYLLPERFLRFIHFEELTLISRLFLTLFISIYDTIKEITCTLLFKSPTNRNFRNELTFIKYIWQ